MIRYLVALLPLFLMLLVALPVNAEEESPADGKKKPQEDYVVLEVDGEKIYYNQVQEIWSSLFPGEGEAPPLAGFGDKVRDNVVRGIVTEKLMVKEAYDQGIDNSPELLEELEALKNKLMVKILLEKRAEQISEDAIRKSYEETIGQMEGKEEIHASHILVGDEETAKELRQKLKDGAEFDQLAKENSTDKGTAVRGGDLGFFTQEQMVPEFAEAAFKLNEGDISEPVKSSFGWHIIKVHERRQLPVPTLEEARAEIVKSLAREANKAYILKLLDSADITYYGPDGEELDLSLEGKAKAEE